MKKKVVVGLSGGVDSSVAAWLLKEQGYDVIGVTMQIWQDESTQIQEENGGCCGLSAVEDARRVAQMLDIPYYVMNFKKEFRENVMDYFTNEYLCGRTPNPCIACNRYVKWESLLQRSLAIGADYIATGHYARIEQLPNGRYAIRNSVTAAKDQTYALYNLTQEQLAGKLGVSAPAVNKWERGNSYPDITLLPVLARTLRVDLNTLLSFQEDLTETEIAEFLNRLYEVSRTEGCGAAFSLAEEKLRQFPNSDALAYSAAGLLEGLLTLFPGTDETARPGREDFVAGLYEQAAQSADPKIREWATYTVASRCIARGDLDRAEALLDQISNTHRDKRELLSALRRKQGRTEEAWTLLERELFDRAHGIQTTLLSLIEMAQAEGDRQRAQGFCDAARRAGEALDLSDYAVLSAPFQLAAAEQDGPAALDLLDRLLHSLTVPWDLSASPLYRHLATKEAAGEAQSVLLEPLLDQVEADPDCAFLREMPEYGTMVEKYRRAADEA